MPMDSIICRKRLDEEHGKPWICRCPHCAQKRKDLEQQLGEQAGHEEEGKKGTLGGEKACPLV